VYCCLIYGHLVAKAINIGDAAKIFKASVLFGIPTIRTQSSLGDTNEVTASSAKINLMETLLGTYTKAMRRHTNEAASRSIRSP
jgi:hypothetical protein